MNLRIRIANLAVSLAVATLAAAVLPDGPSGYSEAQAQGARPQSRRLSGGNRPPANANRVANNATRASRAARNRSATATPSSSGTPPGWTAPPRPAGSAQASGGQAPTPVTPPPQMPAGTGMSRHGTRDASAPAGSGSGPTLGRVVDTVPLTAEQRLRGYQEPSRVRLESGSYLSPDRVPSHSGIAPSANRSTLAARSAEIRRLQAQLGPKNDPARAARQATRRSATSVSNVTDASPPGWRHAAPRLPADLQRSISQGTTLRPTPPPMPQQLPGTLKLSRHLTRESVAPDLGSVVPTVPLTAEQRLRGFSEPSRVRSVSGPYLSPDRVPAHRGIAPSPNATRVAARSAEIRRLQAQLGPKNASVQAARQAGSRSARTVNNATDASPPGWKQNAPRLPANPQRSIAQGTSLDAAPPPLPPQLPGTLKLSRHLTRDSVGP